MPIISNHQFNNSACALLLYLCFSPLAWAEADNTMPMPLVPDNQEEHLTTITLPPAGQPLPEDAKQTLNAITQQWLKEQQTPQPSAPIVLQRGRLPSATIDVTIGQEAEKLEKHKKIEVSLSSKTESKAMALESLQEMAYHALMAGQMEAAISIYKRALALQPGNRITLFGLATTYHRSGQTKQARLIYAQILSKFPDDRDTLNNFLAIISETSPQEALVELMQLEATNPRFSPISAQIGLLYQRMGNNEKAVEYLKKAAILSPENLSYRYNLAILFDQMGKWQEAAMLYRQLLTAAQEGVSIPGDSKKIQERLMFITTPK